VVDQAVLEEGVVVPKLFYPDVVQEGEVVEVQASSSLLHLGAVEAEALARQFAVPLQPVALRLALVGN
jgi:hypothetical protein